MDQMPQNGAQAQVDPMEQINQKLDKIMQKLGISMGDNFEQMDPEAQDAQLKQEYDQQQLLGPGKGKM